MQRTLVIENQSDEVREKEELWELRVPWEEQTDKELRLNYGHQVVYVEREYQELGHVPEEKLGTHLLSKDVVRAPNSRFFVVGRQSDKGDQSNIELQIRMSRTMTRLPTYGNCLGCGAAGPLMQRCKVCNPRSYGRRYKLIRTPRTIVDAEFFAREVGAPKELAWSGRIWKYPSPREETSFTDKELYDLFYRIIRNRLERRNWNAENMDYLYREQMALIDDMTKRLVDLVTLKEDDTNSIDRSVLDDIQTKKRTRTLGA